MDRFQSRKTVGPARASAGSSAGLSRRDLLGASAGALAVACVPGVVGSASSSEHESHGMSAFGDLKYPPDFRHFDYVNPAAPKGGQFSQVGVTRQFNQNFLTFNTLNSYILKGDAAQGMELTFATLMARATDEPDALYGLAARAVRISPDKLTYRFLLRPEARFHDGSKLTAHDVAFSLNTAEGERPSGHPADDARRHRRRSRRRHDGRGALRREARARRAAVRRASADLLARLLFDALVRRDDARRAARLRRLQGRTLRAGRFIEYERVKDWWGADLPVSRGQNNFDVLRYEYYRDRDVAFEGFTGKSYLFREEFTSRIWATRYDFPAIQDGRVKREVLPDDTPSGAQGWFINTRRDKFKDRSLREALIYAFDFEWTNKNLMYGSYERTHSVFQNSDLMAKGKPSAEELALLEPYRGKVPDEVFGEPFVPPVTDGSGQDRLLLRKATQLLQEAGLVIKDGKRMNARGEPFTIEFLLDEPAAQPIHMPYIKNLAALGIEATVRMVDPVQYRARVEDFDFDLTVQRFGFSTTPGDSLRTFFSSQAATLKGSQNLAGIADPAIDAMIGRIIAADTRPHLVVACRALDRLIRAGRYWVPHWYKASHWVAYWDAFSRPADKPRYARGAPETWWHDKAKAAKIERAG